MAKQNLAVIPLFRLEVFELDPSDAPPRFQRLYLRLA